MSEDWVRANLKIEREGEVDFIILEEERIANRVLKHRVNLRLFLRMFGKVIEDALSAGKDVFEELAKADDIIEEKPTVEYEVVEYDRAGRPKRMKPIMKTVKVERGYKKYFRK